MPKWKMDFRWVWSKLLVQLFYWPFNVCYLDDFFIFAECSMNFEFVLRETKKKFLVHKLLAPYMDVSMLK